MQRFSKATLLGYIDEQMDRLATQYDLQEGLGWDQVREGLATKHQIMPEYPRPVAYGELAALQKLRERILDGDL